MSEVQVVPDVQLKLFDPKVEQQLIINAPSVEERLRPRAMPFVLHVAQRAQTITPWGMNPTMRDQELRAFWLSESWLASVVYSVSIRNASFAWEVIGSDPKEPLPKNTVRAVERLLKQSNRGKGWKNLIIKTCIDLYTQDNGSTWQIVRSADRPDAPVINLVSLDAARIWRTGDDEYPVIYTDRYGVEHVMKWWEVRTIEEFPSPIETAYDLQISAVSRCLLAAEIIQSLSTYKMEKISGNFTRAIDFVSGVTQSNIDDGLAINREQILNRGLLRYSVPVVIPGIDPQSTLSHVHLDLASLPDNFSEDESFKWYVAQLAAAFGVDYQEIAPLMTGNLGSSQQSEIMHLKTRGKGPALIMGLFEDIINDGIIPRNVKFRFLEQDLRSESEKAEAKFTRAKTRSLLVKSGELDGKAARQLAIMEGDLPEWLVAEIDEREDKLPEPMSVPEQQRQEFTSEQISGGMETQETKALTLRDVERIRKEVSEDPLTFLSKRIQRKISYGVPGGTIIIPTYHESLTTLQYALANQWKHTATRLVLPEQFHITLVHGLRIDEYDYRAACETLRPYIYKLLPVRVYLNRVGTFDTGGGKAVVGLVASSYELKELQRAFYNTLVALDVPVSEFSQPEKWTPHITLAYIPEEIEVRNQDVKPILIDCNRVEFTRTGYTTEHVLIAPEKEAEGMY